MKVIDLLNKVANGEEVPEEIKRYDNVWKYVKSENDYTNGKEFLFMDHIVNYDSVGTFLNIEFEILEDKPEKIDEEHNFCDYATYNNYNHDVDKVLYIIRAINNLEEKYSNIARTLNYLLEKSDKE